MSRDGLWLRLALAEIPPNRVRLMDEEALSRLAQAVQAGDERQLRLLGLKPAEIARLAVAQRKLEPEEAQLQALDIRAVARSAEDYPSSFNCLASPPHCLFVRGDTALLAAPAVAIVGSRKPSGYGLSLTEALAREVAAAGYTVVSGGALGIDAAAHRGALETGSTITVLGCGLDVTYPREHKELFEQVAAKGALVTEFPLGTEPARWRFPARNRLIAALAEVVVVTDCGAKSGALITAGLALEQGKLVGAVPHAVGAPGSQGPHQLLKQGAACLESAEDILELLGQVGGQPRLPRVADRPAVRPAAANVPTLDFTPEDADSAQLLELLQTGDCTLEELVGRSGLTARAAASSLTILEAMGRVFRDATGRYSLKR